MSGSIEQPLVIRSWGNVANGALVWAMPVGLVFGSLAATQDPWWPFAALGIVAEGLVVSRALRERLAIDDAG